MLAKLFGSNHDERRLGILLALLFLALAVPTGAVIWQAYGQLKWEAFHQLRGQAEELAARIDQAIEEGIAAAENRGFAEFSFLNVTGDPGAGFLQRSPLSTFPVVGDLPGVIGYFQVDAEGRFSTPLLPDADADPAALGIGGEEYRERESLAGAIRRILSGNQLVEGRDAAAVPASQQFFDELAQGPRRQNESASELRQKSKEASAPASPATEYGKVQDLRLDDALQKKSEVIEEESDATVGFEQAGAAAQKAASRSRRVEKSVLPEPVTPAEGSADLDGPLQNVRITTFESELGPYEFAMLGSGQFVLFRNVWRDGARYVQGLLIERQSFVEGAILSAFRAATLSSVTDLVVGFGDDVILLAGAGAGTEGGTAYTGAASGMEGDLLYRSRLSSPLDPIELIFSVSRLPAGPGALVLAWTTLLLMAVFGAGFLALYRLGLGQIRLARQQQDFVSSVSHELKTPLTSIRMYSEMLKEGWVDDARRRQYYEFIHDESERLSRLISNVLQLASITRNTPKFEPRAVTAGELLDRIRSKIASQVERAGFELEIGTDEESARMMVEVAEDCMMQIVINLVDNAVKFSKNAAIKRIEIAAKAVSGGQVRFSVRDYGPGIPREQIKKIFRLFYRPESELTRETVGTGIGLAIVHQLTVAMGGTVDVQNRSPGAEFGVAFPAMVKREA